MNAQKSNSTLLSTLCTLRIGGVAQEVYAPHTLPELQALLTLLGTRRYLVIGRGSNLLFDDAGYREPIIVTRQLCEIASIGRTDLLCACGVPLPALAGRACALGLSGMEFACGIPGTLGGAIAMNAGAYGGEIGALVLYADCFDRAAGKTVRLTQRELSFRYRHSRLAEEELVLLQAALRLTRATPSAIAERMRALQAHRRAHQPLGLPSAGSAFRRTEDGRAIAPMLEALGYRGRREGNVGFSEKHAGFLVSYGDASSHDALALLQSAERAIYDAYGITVEREIEYLPPHGRTAKKERKG